MKKICLLISVSLLLVGCDWIESFSKTKTQEINVFKAPQSVKIDKLTLFTQSLFVKKFYAANDYFTVWIDPQNRVDLIESILNFENDGVDVNKFKLMHLIYFNNNYENLNVYEKTKADFAFTDAFMRIVKLLAHGKINPNKFYSDWVAPQKPIDFNHLLLEGISNNKIKLRIQEQVPTNAYYTGIKEAIIGYQQLPNDSLLNLRGTDYIKIKKKLNYYSDANFSNFNSDWNEEAKQGMKNFQKRHGLYASGNINEESLEALNVSKEKRLQQLRVNLERARWFYKDLGENYVLVNLPECKLFLYENGNLIETHNVIIGKNERKTPVLSSTFSYLVINPTWTVPPTILKNDIVPKATANRGYFSGYRITIYDKNGKIVDPTDWNPENYKNYRYVQKPGSNNALGLIKFDFPNGHSVYLHDTNNRSMFENKKRDLSSGCVRVKDPFELATRILEIEGSTYDRAKLDTLVAKEKTKFISLNKKVNVHQLYWTAWKDAQGIQFRTDIYSLDEGLYKKLIK